MQLSKSFTGFLLILVALTLVCSCEAPRTAPPVSYLYVTPSTTYLRSCPSYGDECDIITQVFAGDRVELLDRNDFGWSFVQLVGTGARGWIVSDLLSYSPVSALYYVSVSGEYLRECADFNCRPLELMNRGDQVEKIDQDNRGWWRVISIKSRNQGWIPVMSVSSRPGPPLYYVNVSSLALRDAPTTASRIITTLGFNEQVEMLGMGPSGWARVRTMRRGIIGWAANRYLESFPVPAPRPVPAKRRAPAKKEAPEPESAPEPKSAPAPRAPAAPKIM